MAQRHLGVTQDMINLYDEYTHLTLDRRGFMENLLSIEGHEDKDNVLKIVLPARLRADALEKLHYMNITSTSLFPGLDGYARSLGIYHPAFRPIRWEHDE